MKTPLLSFFIVLFSFTASSQITTAMVKANFGVDADLKARMLNGNLTAGDDWYTFPGTSGTTANGTFVIDTTGAASVLAGYASDVSPFPKRMASIYRTMSRPAFSVVNNRLWLDALFVGIIMVTIVLSLLRVLIKTDKVPIIGPVVSRASLTKMIFLMFSCMLEELVLPLLTHYGCLVVFL